MSELTFLHSAHYAHCSAVIDKHFDGYHSLQFMSNGSVELFYEDERYLLQGPVFWTAFPGPRIRFHCAPGTASWVHHYVAFTGTRVSDWLAEGLLPRVPQQVSTTSKYKHLFDDLLKHAGRSGWWAPQQATHIMERLLLELAEERAEEEKDEPWLKNVLECLQDEFAPDYALLAQDNGFSVPTLRRRFLAATGTPIHTYALQLRLAHAREMLAESDLPLKAVAEKLGYSDVYFFARQFRQSVGIPPATYRKSLQLRMQDGGKARR
jgi:AraC-like DNA-binding protein